MVATGNVIAQKKKKKKQLEENMGIFVNQEKIHPHSVFSPFWREHFGGPKEKSLGLHYLFSFLPAQPNTLQKSFHFYFLSKVFHLPYFTSKQIHPYVTFGMTFGTG